MTNTNSPSDLPANQQSGTSKWLTIGAIVALIGMAAVTNPNEEQYLDYAAAQFSDRFDNLCDDIELPDMLQGLKDLAREGCSTAATGSQELNVGGQSPIEAAIATATERQNFLIFSLYETQALNRRITTIGLFGQFLSLPDDTD